MSEDLEEDLEDDEDLRLPDLAHDLNDGKPPVQFTNGLKSLLANHETSLPPGVNADNPEQVYEAVSRILNAAAAMPIVEGINLKIPLGWPPDNPQHMTRLLRARRIQSRDSEKREAYVRGFCDSIAEEYMPMHNRAYTEFLLTPAGKAWQQEENARMRQQWAEERAQQAALQDKWNGIVAGTPVEFDLAAESNEERILAEEAQKWAAVIQRMEGDGRTLRQAFEASSVEFDQVQGGLSGGFSYVFMRALVARWNRGQELLEAMDSRTRERIQGTFPVIELKT